MMHGQKNIKFHKEIQVTSCLTPWCRFIL